MGLRFRKSIKIAPGVRLNVGKKSSSISFGGKGLRYTISSTGKRTASAGIPGTGISYVTSSQTKAKGSKTNAYRNYRSLQQEEKQIQKQQELQYAQHQVAVFENQMELIQSIHKECDDEINWKEIAESKPPYVKTEPGPREQAALEAIQNYKPGVFEKLFKKDIKKRDELEKQLQKAKAEDVQEYKEWEKLVSFAKHILDKDIDTYFEVIEEMEPFADLAEFGSGFELTTEDPPYMEVEFDVNTETMVPKEEKKLTKTGKLSVKPMTKTRYYELKQDYVCSCIIRIARDLFALLPLDYVRIHAYENQLNSATGHVERVLIVSVKIDRPTLNALNFDRIDCSDAMDNFPHHMNFRKTKGFGEVKKLEG